MNAWFPHEHRTASGEVVFDGQARGGGGASQTVKAVDLGVIDIAAVVAGGPVKLYTMQPGEFLSTVRWTDTDYEDIDTLPFPFGVGTVKSFGWMSFAPIQNFPCPADATFHQAWANATAMHARFWDTLSLQIYGLDYDPRSATLGTQQEETGAMILSAAAAGDIYAAAWCGFSGGFFAGALGEGASVRLGPIAAWASAHAYDALNDSTIATAGAVKNGCIVANGTVWGNIGDAGNSGGSAPDFAGNAGGQVADGANIIWADTGVALPTTGKVHAVAEIWTPA